MSIHTFFNKNIKYYLLSRGKVVTPSVRIKKIKIPKSILLSLTKIKRNTKNIKLHSDEQIHDLMELMKMVGFKDPIVIDRKFNIWAGHGRLDAAEKLKMKKVPCIYLDKLSEYQKKAFLIMDNKVNESPWVAENVKIIFDEVPQIHFDNFQMNFDDYFQKNLDVTEEEWQNMPEFTRQSDDDCRKIVLKFENEKDVKKFAKLIKQNVTDLTRWLWYPYKADKKTTTHYVDES